MKTVQITPEKRAAQAAKLAEQVALFDSLPDCALVALPVVCAITGRSPASVWRDVTAKRISAPISAGPRCTRWRKKDLLASKFAGGK